MRGQMGTYAYFQIEAICNFIMAQLWKSAQRNSYTQNNKTKTDQQ